MAKQSSFPNSLRASCSVLASSLLGLIFTISQPSVTHAIEPKEYTLSNDMKVILVEVPKAPVATVQVWYKVGSRNEVMGRAGLSHMLEHMMFKGTAKYPKGTFSRLVRKNGGMDNAFTSQDFTAYFENLAADRVTLALELEADRMQGLILDANEFKTEREVVKEERRLRNEDDPQGALVEALFAQAFMSHPYHWPVIGWFSDLDAMNLDDLQRHYDTYYSPNNATLVVVGDIKVDTLLPVIARLFEPIPKGPSPQTLTVAEGPQRGERRFLLKREAQVPFVMMGYRVPNYTSDDSYALNVLESILSHGKSARLYQSLVYDQKTALAVGADYGLMQADPGLFYFYAVVKPGEKVEAVEDAVVKEIHRLQAEPPSDVELQRAKNQIEAAHIFEQDSNFRQAMLLGEAETIGAGWRKVSQFVERTRAVTAQDVQRVAAQYLTPDTRTTGTLIPLPPQTQSALPPPSH
ncbi:MAG: insulinase family protein [Nitrospira sp. CR1.2]|nr:insulinase family protein [Nitrospira sp. CR1.2]